jgi:hypothetical protein
VESGNKKELDDIWYKAYDLKNGNFINRSGPKYGENTTLKGGSQAACRGEEC